MRVQALNHQVDAAVWEAYTALNWWWAVKRQVVAAGNG